MKLLTPARTALGATLVFSGLLAALSQIPDATAPVLPQGPESRAELMRSISHRNLKVGEVPLGAVRNAYERSRLMQPLKAKVAGANGNWAPYGVGNLLADAGFETGNMAARVDNFAYDAVHQRLFAAVGTGGVFMTTATGGDITTLADNWVSVGENLPTQIIGGVAWTPDVDGDGDADPATDGTLIAAGGEAVMGSGAYLGLGAFWTANLGQTWNQASGVPDQALVFQAVADPVNPAVVYVASSKGLFRSADAGRSYVNVRLPTGACAGVEDISSPCFYANYVTDVLVQQPGGSTDIVCDPAGCPVVAGVGFRTGSSLMFQDGTTPQAPANGIYRSSTGVAGSFARVDVATINTSVPVGFTPQDRIGRIELGAAVGPDQDHNYLYAIVQDAVTFNAGFPVDAPLDLGMNPLPIVPFDTVFNGLYVSSDFGTNWLRMADRDEIATNVSTGTGMLAFGAQGSGPGGQTWYDAWIKADPTRTDPVLGVPTRLTFGIEEIWQNRVTTGVPLDGSAQQGNNDFKVIGAYNILGAEVAANLSTTTHADQHTAIYIPTGDGGVCLIIGGDGGVFKQCKGAGVEMDNSGWGTGANSGMYTLLPYGIGVAKDGTVYFGLQDNGSGLIDPQQGLTFRETMGGDGFYAEVDPDNSDLAYYETQNGGLTRTPDRGVTNEAIAPTYTRVMFDNWFRMDPLDAEHMFTAAQEVYETSSASTVSADTWVEVFNLGTNPATGAIRTTTNIEIMGTAVYVGGCGDCGASGNDTGFQNVLATNVQDGVARVPETGAGWHFATAAGLDNRFITGMAIDPNDVKTLYVSIGGYLSAIRPPGAFLDPNAAIGSHAVFKSTDAGESFTNISGNLPDMQAASIVLRGNQLLLATDFGVFISSDTTGSSWAPLGSGLPNAPVNMLRLQPGNPDKLFAATFGRFVWVYDFASSVGGGVDPLPVTTADQGRFGSGAMPLGLLLVLLLTGLARQRRTARR